MLLAHRPQSRREKSKRRENEREVTEMRELMRPKAMTTPAVISPEDLKALVETQYENPVISLYLRLNPEKMKPLQKGLLRSFHSLNASAIKERKDFIKTLSRAQKQTLTQDLEEIEVFLSEYLVPANLRSLIIFKSGETVNRIFRLPVRTADSLSIDVDPYILPLETVLEENPRVLMVEVSKEKSRFLSYHLGRCWEAGKVRSFVPTGLVDKSIPGRVQRHRLNHLHLHLKETARRTYQLYSQLGCEALMLIADKRILSQFEDFLHETLREEIISRIHSSPAGETRDRKELIEDALRDHKSEVEAKGIEELSAYKPREELVSGLGQVIDACNSFLIRRLLVGQSLRHEGFVCAKHHYVSLEDADCPVCGARVLPVENVIDEIVEISRLHRVDVDIVEIREELLAGYDGIAAVLHYRLAQRNAS
jgi:hypothetical protein